MLNLDLLSFARNFCSIILNQIRRLKISLFGLILLLLLCILEHFGDRIAVTHFGQHRFFAFFLLLDFILVHWLKAEAGWFGATDFGTFTTVIVVGDRTDFKVRNTGNLPTLILFLRIDFNHLL